MTKKSRKPAWKPSLETQKKTTKRLQKKLNFFCKNSHKIPSKLHKSQSSSSYLASQADSFVFSLSAISL
jgi:hypothetical protein